MPTVMDGRKQTAAEFCAWLAPLEGVHHVRPVRITLGINSSRKGPYEGASYFEERFGDSEHLVLAAPFTTFKDKGNTVWTTPDGREWYVACYAPAGHKDYPQVILCPWQVPSGEKIDAHDYNRRTWNKITRPRRPLTIEYLD